MTKSNYLVRQVAREELTFRVSVCRSSDHIATAFTHGTVGFVPNSFLGRRLHLTTRAVDFAIDYAKVVLNQWQEVSPFLASRTKDEEQNNSRYVFCFGSACSQEVTFIIETGIYG
jgi:hypothetical protein